MPLHSAQERSERLEARITRRQKDLLRQAAAIQGRTVSDFVVHAASEAASRVVQDHQAIMLDAREQATFVRELLNPSKPGPRLRAAARHYRKIMS